MKRKAKRDGALTNNQTPKESLPDSEFAAEEEPIKGANRNSKKGNSTGE
jgi:hypothetical protein